MATALLNPDEAGSHGVFATTRWSVVLAAGNKSPEALEDLCRTYWYPVYAFVRRRGRGPDDAMDLTQEFFGRILEKEFIGAADPAKGRFRSFLLRRLGWFLADKWDKERAEKRGGGRKTISLDEIDPEKRYAIDAAINLSPDKLYEKEWALALLGKAIDRLQQEYNRAARVPSFNQLKVYLLPEDDSQSSAELARDLGMSKGALRMVVHRLRRRFGEIMREEVGHTLNNPTGLEIDGELRHLLQVIAD
jgi:RNA polymerase sigma-70 factor (ECF subfamily)